jgi:hypothetical protein
MKNLLMIRMRKTAQGTRDASEKIKPIVPVLEGMLIKIPETNLTTAVQLTLRTNVNKQGHQIFGNNRDVRAA